MQHPYYSVKLLDWINKAYIYIDPLSSNPSPATMQFLIDNSDFSKPQQVYTIWGGAIIPWCFGIWENISANPDAIDILEKYQKHIHWNNFCRNTSPRAIKILAKNPGKINWRIFSENPAREAVDYMIQNPDKIDWEAFCINSSPKAIEYLMTQYADKIDWYSFMCNPAREAMDIIKTLCQHIDYRSCVGFLQNPAAVEILRASAKRGECDEFWIIWLYKNPNPDIMSVIRELVREDDIDWKEIMHYHPKLYRKYNSHTNDIINNLCHLSMIQEYVDLIENNQKSMYWADFSQNPAIFEYVYDYAKIKKERRELNEQIVAAYWHPSRVACIIESGAADIEDYF